MSVKLEKMVPDDDPSPPPDAAADEDAPPPPSSAEGEASRSEAKRDELLERCVASLGTYLKSVRGPGKSD
eukprot:scaffold39448_cov58-Phaeocystis_antarctica.AAC.1